MDSQKYILSSDRKENKAKVCFGDALDAVRNSFPCGGYCYLKYMTQATSRFFSNFCNVLIIKFYFNCMQARSTGARYYYCFPNECTKI